MTSYDMTYHLELDKQQEKLLETIYNKTKDEFNYTRADVLDYIIHHPVYYEFTDESRTNYKDIENTVIKGIEIFEANLIKP